MQRLLRALARRTIRGRAILLKCASAADNRTQNTILIVIRYTTATVTSYKGIPTTFDELNVSVNNDWDRQAGLYGRLTKRRSRCIADLILKMENQEKKTFDLHNHL